MPFMGFLLISNVYIIKSLSAIFSNIWGNKCINIEVRWYYNIMKILSTGKKTFKIEHYISIYVLFL